MATPEIHEPPSTQGPTESMLQQLEHYPWASDPEFQSGLQAILGSNASPEQEEHLTLRARCFYFSRKNNIPIDFNAYQTWRSQHISSSLTNGASSQNPEPTLPSLNRAASSSTPSPPHEISPTSSNTEPPAPYPTSFSQIVELITSGQPIPGIKEVPDTVLEGQASQPTTAKRKKPWEKDDAGGGEEITGITQSAS
ncbi:hypothetical protein MMC28_000612 [Mycoblastus sanguinarius]|nr:hypothetical protein [Mycoblastus sanguinarius]